MTTSKALQILFDECTTYYDLCNDADKHRVLEWGAAFSHITDKLGVVFDKETEQWVTADTGDVI